ncbi:MAG: hypothetical protein O2927_05145, partial [Planctomycetota bacterium]|nr:hypothetical protein [Planctomycetota bacterium]
LRSLERRFREAARVGASAVVLELDTPGGEMLATLDICHLIRTEAPSNTVAWINPKAFSAGTIIALACRETLVHPDAVFGDAAPIQGIPIVGLRQMPVAERAKIEAPLLSEVVGSARRRGIDEKLVQAFIAVTMELWLIEEIETGDRLYVDAGEYEIAFGEPPPRVRERGAALPAVEAVASPIALEADEEETAPFVLDDPDADDSPRRLLTPGDRGRWRLLGQVIGNEELLVVRSNEAIGHGLATGTAATDADVATFFGATSVIRLDRSWSESMVRFLISWPVRLLLIVVLLVCFFIELAAPGVGIFGITAGLALLLLLGAPAVAGMAQWWEILLVLVGFALVAVELFALPGIGFAGLAGVICLFVGIVGTFIGGGVGGAGGGAWQDQLVTGLATTLAAAFAGGVAIWIIARQFGSVRGFDRLVLGASLSRTGQPPVGRSRDASGRRDTESGAPMPAKGSVGVALSPLRPAGRAEFDGRTFDVRSVGDYVEAGTAVRTLGTEGSSLLVEAAS